MDVTTGCVSVSLHLKLVLLLCLTETCCALRHVLVRHLFLYIPHKDMCSATAWAAKLLLAKDHKKLSAAGEYQLTNIYGGRCRKCFGGRSARGSDSVKSVAPSIHDTKYMCDAAPYPVGSRKLCYGGMICQKHAALSLAADHLVTPESMQCLIHMRQKCKLQRVSLEYDKADLASS